MEREKLSAIAFIAIILGAVGAGVGGYAVGVILTGGADGDDGDDGDDGAAGITTTTIIMANEYYCLSEANINDALSDIDDGYGKIIIMGDITLTSTIQIDGGGSYIIEGTGLHTIDCGGDRTAFNITNAISCTIRNIKINASDVSASTVILAVNETGNYPVYIEKLQIMGNLASYVGRGVEIQSANVWISNCYFYRLYGGIYFEGGGHNGRIIYNTIDECFHQSIYCETNNIIIENNWIEKIQDDATYALENEGDDVIIENNLVYTMRTGIRNSGNNVIIESNIVNATSPFGVGINNKGDSVIIEGNSVKAGTWGIISDLSNYTIIADNILDSHKFGIHLNANDRSTITGNMIYGGNRSYGDNSYGIRFLTNSDYNVINGNLINAYHNTGATGYGIYIEAFCAENTVVGNTALSSDIDVPFLTNDASTFGNSTNNNFV